MFCYDNRVTVQLVSVWKIGRYPFRDVGLLSYRCGNAKKINKLEHLQLQVLGAVPIVKFGIVPKMTYWQFFIFSTHYLWLKVMPWPAEGLLRVTKYDNGIFFLKACHWSIVR